MLTDKKIQDFVIIKNFINKFINDNIHTVINSFTPFLNKKLKTLNGLVSKYSKPNIPIEIIEELKNIGIVRLELYLDFNISTKRIDIYFNFHIYGNDTSIFKNQYDNPFGSSTIKTHALTIHTNEDKLILIEDYQQKEILNIDSILENYNAALIKKAEYEKALSKVNSFLSHFIRMR